MRTSKSIVILFFCVCMICIASCTYNKEELLYPNVTSCDTTDIGFAAKINPIFVNNCITCHGPGGSEEGYQLNTYSLINSESAIAYERMNDALDPMPPSGRLDPCEINAFKIWIDNGKLNN